MQQRGNQRPVTLSDIAKATGYSRFTAGHVLKGTKPFPESTCRKILAAAKRLGYRPNASATAMRYGRFQAVGLLTDQNILRSSLPELLLHGILARLDALQHHLIVARFPEAEATGSQPRSLSHLMVDGLLLNFHSEFPEGLLTWLAGSPFPLVRINQPSGKDTIRPDDARDARTLTEGMIRSGHRRIAFYCAHYHVHLSLTRHFSVDLRLQGYRQAIDAAGLERIEILDHLPESIPESLAAILKPPRSCTAMVCYSGLNEMALAALAHGMRLPQDLLLAGIGELNTDSYFLREQIGYMTINWELIGTTAVDLLFARINGAPPQPCRLVPGTLTMPKA